MDYQNGICKMLQCMRDASTQLTDVTEHDTYMDVLIT